MSEIIDTTHDSLPPEPGESKAASPEAEQIPDFKLLPYDAGNFPEGRLAIVRATNATLIKDSLQDYTRLEGPVRHFREVSTRGDYIWSIVADLGMTASEFPDNSYRNTFAGVHEKAIGLKSSDIGELMDKYEDHPTLSFIDTLEHIVPKTDAIKTELVMLRRSMLVLLDECS